MKIGHKRTVTAIKAEWNSMMKSDIELFLIGHGFSFNNCVDGSVFYNNPVEKYDCGPKTLDFICREVSKTPGNEINIHSRPYSNGRTGIIIYIKESEKSYYKSIPSNYIKKSELLSSSPRI